MFSDMWVCCLFCSSSHYLCLVSLIPSKKANGFIQSLLRMIRCIPTNYKWAQRPYCFLTVVCVNCTKTTCVQHCFFFKLTLNLALSSHERVILFMRLDDAH